MFQTNVGGIDRVVRIIAGIAFLLAWVLLPGHGFRLLFLIVGILALGTGLLRTCPLYSLLGISTCPLKRE